MSDRDRIEMEGTILLALGNGNFRVQISENYEVLCALSGKIRMNNIKVIEGDKVKIEISPYDPARGRITFRIK